MTKEQREIRILKAVVHAQDKMLQQYRLGERCLPEAIFYAFVAAKDLYKVRNISEI